MSQETPWRPEEAVTYAGPESTLGSSGGAPTMTRTFPVSGTVETKLEQEEIPIDQESIHLFDLQNPVKGIKKCSFGCEYYLQPDGTQLNSAASPATHPLGVFLKAAFGNETVAAGSTVDSSGSGTAVTVAAGHGSRFAVGAWALFPISSSLLPGRVSVIATDALTLDLGIGSAATSSGDIMNMYNYSPSASSTQSLYIQHVPAGSTTNFAEALKGCIAESLELGLELNKAATAKFKFQGIDWERPSDDSITTTVGTDTMGTPFAMDGNAVMILQSTGTATLTQYPLLSVSVKLNLGMQYAMTLGGVQGRSSAYRAGNRMFAEITVKAVSADITPHSTWWTDRTDLQCVLMVPFGSGATKRWLVIDAPKVAVIGTPETVKEGGMATTQFVLHTKMRSRSASTTQGRSPFTIAFG